MSCTIIVGCYRTGSSAIAGILHHLGIYMGETFDLPDQNNPKGYWEDLEFKKIHERFYAQTNPSEDYHALIEDRENKHEHWGVKDPLLCFYFDKLVQSLRTNSRLIMCIRPWADIADSMLRASRCQNNDFMPLVQHYCESMASITSEYDGPTLHVYPITAIATNPKKLVEDIAQFVGLPVTEAALKYMEVE